MNITLKPNDARIVAEHGHDLVEHLRVLGYGVKSVDLHLEIDKPVEIHLRCIRFGDCAIEIPDQVAGLRITVEDGA